MELSSVFLNRVLSETAKKNASVLHLSVGSRPALKVDDQLIGIDGENPISAELISQIMSNILSVDEIEIFKKEKEMTVVKIFLSSIRFRVNFFHQKGQPSISFYYIQPLIRELASYSFPLAVNDITKINHGLLIISGSFGSGRTTTAMSFLEEINKTQGRSITMIEEQSEVVLLSKKSLISQRQIGVDVSSVSEALDYCLDDDVDVVYVSRIRDGFGECLSKILRLSSGNSLVILEMDDDNVIKVIQTMIGAIENDHTTESVRYNIADSILAIIVQKLVPRIGGGMIMANELMIANAPIKSLIREGKVYQIDSVMQTSRQDGMMSMSKSLDELFKLGRIRPENAK